jgi:hypothetical protein
MDDINNLHIKIINNELSLYKYSTVSFNAVVRLFSASSASGRGRESPPVMDDGWFSASRVSHRAKATFRSKIASVSCSSTLSLPSSPIFTRGPPHSPCARSHRGIAGISLFQPRSGLVWTHLRGGSGLLAWTRLDQAFLPKPLALLGLCST